MNMECCLESLITFVDVRNSESKDLPLLGINLNKKFFPSVANVVGTDLSKYKILKDGMFACNLMHVGRDAKVPIALYKGDDAIVSPAYPTFVVKDNNYILPEYLMLLFRRSVFDAEAEFYASAGIRGGFEMEDFLNVMLPVPPIEEQRRIVAEYQTVERRIANNNAMIQKLEETALAIYHHTFVENIDENNLPEGWRKGTLEEILDVSSGKTVDDKTDDIDNFHKYPVAGASGIIGYSSNFNRQNRLLTTGRVGTLGVVRKYSEPIWAADNVLVIESDYYEYSYQLLKNIKYEEIAKGGVQALLTQSELKKYPAIIPTKNVINRFEKQSSIISSYIENIGKENEYLTELLSLLTSKIS